MILGEPKVLVIWLWHISVLEDPSLYALHRPSWLLSAVHLSQEMVQLRQLKMSPWFEGTVDCTLINSLFISHRDIWWELPGQEERRADRLVGKGGGSWNIRVFGVKEEESARRRWGSPRGGEAWKITWNSTQSLRKYNFDVIALEGLTLVELNFPVMWKGK